MNFLEQSTLLLTVASFAIGFSVLARNVRNKLFIAFCWTCQSLSLWAFLFFMARLRPGSTFYHWHLVLNLWIVPASLTFMRYLSRVRTPILSAIWRVSFFGAILLSPPVLMGYADQSSAFLQLVLFFPALIFFHIFHVMLVEPRYRIICAGALLVLATTSLDHIPAVGPILPIVGNVLFTIYLFFLGQSIRQHRFMNWPVILSRALAMVVIAGLLTALYSVIFAWIRQRPLLFILNSFIVSLLVVMLIDPIRNLMNYLTGRLLTRKHREADVFVRAAVEKLALVVDSDQFVKLIMEVTHYVLKPQKLELYLLDSMGARFQSVRADGVRGNQEILRTCAIIQMIQEGLQKKRIGVLLESEIEREADRAALKAERDKFSAVLTEMRQISAGMIIPLVDQESVLAFLALDHPKPEELWGINWGNVRLLYEFFGNCARTLKSLEIYVRQSEQDRLAGLGHMAAGLAHEIRNPLGSIRGSAELLVREEKLKPESRKFAQIIIDETERLNQVVTQFLDLSRAYGQTKKIYDLGEFAKRSLELLRPGLPPSLRISGIETQQEKFLVEIVPEQIQQVFINILQNAVNALEAKPEKLITIELGKKTSHQGQKEFILSITDNGKGINRDDLNRLFVPFYTTSPKGIGLGLSVSQKIVQAHGGRIEVESQWGAGSRFSIVLPAKVTKS